MIFRARPLVAMNHYALSFDGSNDYVNCGASADFDVSTGITFGAKINTSAATEQIILSRDNPTDRIFQWKVDSSTHKIQFTYFSSNNSYSALSNTVVNDGAWHHVAISYDGANIKFFLDYAIDGQVAETRSIDTNPSQSLRMGELGGGGYNFNGMMRDISYWNVAISEANMEAYMKSPVGRTGLVSYWPFREGSGSVLGDQAGVHDGTITGATWVKL